MLRLYYDNIRAKLNAGSGSFQWFLKLFNVYVSKFLWPVYQFD